MLVSYTDLVMPGGLPLSGEHFLDFVLGAQAFAGAVPVAPNREGKGLIKFYWYLD